VTEDVGSEILNRVDGRSTAGQLKTASQRRRKGFFFRAKREKKKEKKSNRSMFLLLALLNAKIPSLASISRDRGSIPFWLMITKPFLVPSQTFLLNSTILRTRLSMNDLSASTILSRSSGFE